MSATCSICHGAVPIGRKEPETHTALCAEVIRADRDEVMKALARHDGRGWCAVCGFNNAECAERSPNCLGARARREHPSVVPLPNAAVR
jgi:hypothetical protein